MSSTRRQLTLARITAVVAIALVFVGLAVLRYAPDGTVSVPAGAHAGQLTLKRCQYATERGDYAADCGTLVVPENRARPGSRLIALPVTRIRARSSERHAPLFRLEGGPGLTNMDFTKASRFAGTRDVVLVGYRGIDGSSRLDCSEVSDVMRRSTDLLASVSLRRQAAAFKACATRLREKGVDLAGFTLSERVDDLEAARKALRYGRVDLVSESAGTRTAMIYAWRHPKSVRRSVMLAANPPGHFLWNAETVDRQIRHYARLCAAAHECRQRTDDLAQSIRRGAANLPGRWGPLKIKAGNVRAASFWGLIDSSEDAAPLAAPMTIDTWLADAEGDPSGLWLLSLSANLIFPHAQVWGDVAAIGRTDADSAAAHFARRPGAGSILGDAGGRFLWADGGLASAWPAAPDEDRYDEVRSSAVETLVISGSIDFAAPAEVATRELMPHLPNGRQVILREFGHTTDLWDAQPAASTRLIRDYLDTGRVHTFAFRHRSIDFTPARTQTTLAKMLVGAMVGLALLALLSLIWLALRVRRRGRIGARAAVPLRSLFPVILGLGGWCLASLVVLTATPGVPIDDGLLVVLATGAPIAAGIYCAWVDRDWAAETKQVGLAAALLSAMIGGWLGLHAADPPFALVTATAGAIAATNLALIAVSIARERTPRPEPVATRPLVAVR